MGISRKKMICEILEGRCLLSFQGMAPEVDASQPLALLALPYESAGTGDYHFAVMLGSLSGADARSVPAVTISPTTPQSAQTAQTTQAPYPTMPPSPGDWLWSSLARETSSAAHADSGYPDRITTSGASGTPGASERSPVAGPFKSLFLVIHPVATCRSCVMRSAMRRKGTPLP
jgi:hypothetical protein